MTEASPSFPPSERDQNENEDILNIIDPPVAEIHNNRFDSYTSSDPETQPF